MKSEATEQACLKAEEKAKITEESRMKAEEHKRARLKVEEEVLLSLE